MVKLRKSPQHLGPLRNIRYYIVGFFDLVGIGQELCELAKCFTITQEEIDRLGCLASKVIHFRDDFEKFEKGEQHVSQKFDQSASNKEREWRRRHKGNPVKVFTFSDTVVAYASLDTAEKQVPLDSCLNILMKAAASQLFSLVRKIPVRGGIEIGLGVEISDFEVFGTGIYEAYRLERAVADWPRIVVGERLRTYIVNIANGIARCESDHLNQECARFCQKLLYVDCDNVAMVDLRSPVLAAICGNNYSEWLMQARTFVSAEVERFTKQGDSKLANRYTKLLAYLQDERE